ncbi:MBOAT family O-acyltransferase [Rugosimonospora africana]|uniref:Alginate O-acetyltransferase n=1 Tax=Rugosimonospora africana TaxID=556532 RepID=A0A8J3VQQ7_9ACTN|nr:MBOAT family protein [Rugosimonospora africana]GIH14741.1 alginate O-acetyltransferase [Rugosimonospora africana]
MSFASPTFLWFFLPAVLGLYWLLPGRCRNGLIASASLVFYIWGAGSFVLLLAASILCNYLAGLALARDRRRRTVLVAAIVAQLAVLAVWKYVAFASAQLHHVFAQVPALRIALPIGISFFTFHGLSYLIDVYRGSRAPQRSPVAFAMYIAMFPQLISGPIVRYHEIADQLAQTSRNKVDDLAAGFPRFALGLAKKVLIADSIAPIADAVFGADPATLDWRTAWIGALAYTVQIYFDFSGYSDMAIGLGRMLGLQLPENFDRPYSAVSITDFWRRWHMSLSRWFRDYLYIPLGGNQGSAGRTYRNLVIVFVLCGIWHGANWTFLAWGLYHGVLLIVERVTGLARLAPDRYVVARRAGALLFVVVGWVFFRAGTVGQAVGMLHAMAVPRLTATSTLLVDADIGRQAAVMLCAGLAVVLLPRHFAMGRLLSSGTGRLALTARYACSVLAIGYVSVLVAAGTFSPFLYYQF